MSSISSVGGYSSYSPYQMIAGGSASKKAAESASEPATVEKASQETKGLEKSSENTKTAKSALNVEDGAMSGIADYLKSLKEQSVKAMNGTLSDSDIKTVQEQVKQFMKEASEEKSAKSSGEEHALTYNSHAAMELNGFQVNKEEENTENAAQQVKSKQAMDMYQTTLQAQKKTDQEQRSMLLFA